SYRRKRIRSSFEEEGLDVKLPAPCKLSKVDPKTLESPASPPVEASTLLSPESPPPLASSMSLEKTPSPTKDTATPVIIPQSPVIHQCRLCSTCAPFRSEYDLLVHLTVIHFRSKLMKRVTRPYKCLKCNYTPPATDDAAEELLMHYGCDEKLSFQFYEQELKSLEQEESPDSAGDKEDSSARISLNCELCNSAFDTERLFMRHISLRHFTKVLSSDLPKRRPFFCPYPECGKEKSNLHGLMLHYGCEHNISMDLYLKATEGSKGSIRVVVDEPQKSPTRALDFPSTEKKSPAAPEKYNKPSSLSLFHCQKCPKKKFPSQMSLNYHLMVTHFFPDLPKTGPYICHKCKSSHPERLDFTKHFLEVHLHEYLDSHSPSSEGKKSSKPSEHPPELNRHADVRRKVTQKWEITSVEVQNHRIEELEIMLLDLKNEQEETLRKKSSEFEKWVLQKENQLEEEFEKRKAVQESLERSKSDALELERQLKEVQDSHKSSEEILVEKHNLHLSLSKEKEALDKEVDQFKAELKESRDLQANLESSLKELKVEFDSRGDSIAEKEEELKELRNKHSKASATLEKNLNKANKALETIRTKLKQANESKKTLNAQIKEDAKAAKKTASDLQKEIEELKEANEDLIVRLEEEKKKKSTKETAQVSKLKKSVEELSSQLQDSSEKIQGLEAEKKSLSDRIEKVVKIFQDYETVLQEKNEKLKENKARIEELESSSKTGPNGKETEEHAQALSSLKESLSDVKKKYAKCSSQIVVLNRHKSNLEDRLKESQNNLTAFNKEKNIFNKSLKSNDDRVSSLLAELKSQEAQNAKNAALISSGRKEIISLETKLREGCKQCSSSRGFRTHEGNNHLVDTIESLETTVHNKDMEIEHLKVNLNQLKSEMRKEKVALEAEIKSLKAEVAEKPKQKEAVTEENKPLPPLIHKNAFHPQIVKMEPIEVPESEPVPLFNASTPSIVLNFEETLAGVQEQLPDDPQLLLSPYNSEDENSSPEDEDDGAFDLFVFPSFASSTRLNKVTHRRKSKTTSPSNTKKRKSEGPLNILEDMTGKIDESEEDVDCGICLQYDPPLPEDAPRSETYNTEWVGCDCGAWYHKICTKLSKFSLRFSCKSVKKKCICHDATQTTQLQESPTNLVNQV
ncbi:Uncharacterized protein FKW44_023455, partial [Caligus rogercresseyi]